MCPEIVSAEEGVVGEILIKYPIVGQLMIEATIYMTHNHWDWGVREYFQMNM